MIGTSVIPGMRRRLLTFFYNAISGEEYNKIIIEEKCQLFDFMILDDCCLDCVFEHDVVSHVGVVVEQRRYFDWSEDSPDSGDGQQEEQEPPCPGLHN